MKDLCSFCTDNRLRIIFLGKKIAELTGRSSSIVMGKKYHEVLPRIYHEGRDAISVAFKKNNTLILKGYSFNCLGAEIKADIRIRPLKDMNGKVNRVKVSICPHQKCSAAEKLKYTQRLIDIGKIASTFAHRIRNPLNAIKGAVVYLREKYAREPTLIEFTNIIEDEISRLDSFISRFLSTSELDLESSEVDINSLLRKIGILTSLQAHSCNVKTVYEYGSIPHIRINPFQLEQAILNVINNAIEAMPSGGQLTVKTLTKNYSDTDFVITEISDTGPGISKGRINNLSMPLDSKNGKGKGYGLFITYEILRSYGGHLEIKSQKGAGTTVSLYVPVSRSGGMR